MVKKSTSEVLFKRLLIEAVRTDLKASVLVTCHGGELREYLPAVMIGCEYGSTTEIGESEVYLLENDRHPLLVTKLEELGTIGKKGDRCMIPIGNCAENDAANKVLNRDNNIANLNQLAFTIPLRPRTFSEIPTCENCEYVSGENI